MFPLCLRCLLRLAGQMSVVLCSTQHEGWDIVQPCIPMIHRYSSCWTDSTVLLCLVFWLSVQDVHLKNMWRCILEGCGSSNQDRAGTSKHYDWIVRCLWTVKGKERGLLCSLLCSCVGVEQTPMSPKCPYSLWSLASFWYYLLLLPYHLFFIWSVGLLYLSFSNHSITYLPIYPPQSLCHLVPFTFFLSLVSPSLVSVRQDLLLLFSGSLHSAFTSLRVTRSSFPLRDKIYFTLPWVTRSSCTCLFCDKVPCTFLRVTRFSPLPELLDPFVSVSVKQDLPSYPLVGSLNSPFNLLCGTRCPFTCLSSIAPPSPLLG